MTLKQYMALTGQTQMQLAARLGVRHTTISRWCTGQNIPRPKMIAKIQRLTDGAVSFRDFINE